MTLEQIEQRLQELQYVIDDYGSLSAEQYAEWQELHKVLDDLDNWAANPQFE